MKNKFQLDRNKKLFLIGILLLTIGLIYLFNLFYSFENIFFFKSDIRKYQLFKRKEIKERDIFTFTFEKYIVVNDTVKILFEIDPDSSFISANISYFNPTYTISLYDEYEKYLRKKKNIFLINIWKSINFITLGSFI